MTRPPRMWIEVRCDGESGMPAALAWFAGGFRFLPGTPWPLLGVAGLEFAASASADRVAHYRAGQ